MSVSSEIAPISVGGRIKKIALWGPRRLKWYIFGKQIEKCFDELRTQSNNLKVQEKQIEHQLSQLIGISEELTRHMQQINQLQDQMLGQKDQITKLEHRSDAQVNFSRSAALASLRSEILTMQSASEQLETRLQKLENGAIETKTPNDQYELKQNLVS